MSDDREIEELQAELDAVLSDWNAIVKASGSPTHGTAIGHVAAMRAEVERLRSLLREVAGSGVQLAAEPPGLTYATVQIEGELWERIGKEFGQ